MNTSLAHPNPRCQFSRRPIDPNIVRIRSSFNAISRTRIKGGDKDVFTMPFPYSLEIVPMKVTVLKETHAVLSDPTGAAFGVNLVNA